MNLDASHEGLQCERVDNVTIIRFLDRRLTGHIAVQLIGDEIRRIIDQHDSPLVVLNLAPVEILSSAMIGKLIEFKNRVAKRNGRLVLTNVSRQVHEILHITQIDRLFDVKQDEADGLASL